MASFFASNPFTSPVGQRIENATDEKLASEDWSLNIEICDIINETDEGPKDAVRAIRKRLTAPKNFKVIMLTLTVLETCVKNCNKRFHILVCNKEFLNDMTRLMQPKFNAPTIVQDKILTLIQTWSDAFRGKPDLEAVTQVYQSLKTQGILFPAQNLDAFSPIFTPEKSTPEQPPPTQPRHQAQAAPPMTPPQYHHHPPAAPSATGAAAGYRPCPKTLTPDKLGKLRSQLDVVQANVQVMSEMLTAVHQGQVAQEDNELLKELNRTCRSMQTRIVQLLDQVGSEEVTEELLRVNDDLNNVFIRYDRYERNRIGQPTSVQTPPDSTPPPTTVELPAASSGAPPPSAAPLIDFGDDVNTRSSSEELNERVARQFQGPAVTGGSINRDDDEFDMFAQTRNMNLEDSRKTGSTYEDNSTSIPDRTIASTISDRPMTEAGDTATAVEPRAIEGVEDWLTISDLPTQPAVPEQSSMTSSEFDDFLQQRAVSGGARNSQKSKTNPRQMKKEVDDSEDMFSL